jgi:steroid delta-isomerase
MLLIADSLGGKPLKGWLSAAADITKPYSINQLSRYWDVVKRGTAGWNCPKKGNRWLIRDGREVGMTRVIVRGIGLSVAGVLAMLLVASHAPAADDDSAAVQNQIRVELEKWKLDFNAGDASRVCALFAPDLISNFRPQPEDTYNSLCANLQAALTDPAKTYHYDLEIKEILVSGDLAVVRLVWTLKVRPKDATSSEVTTREPGMDIFRRQADGSWKISRYMAYEAPGPT